MILSMAVVMIPMHIRFVVCGELTIPHLGLIYYCFYKRKIAMRNLGRPSRSDFVQSILCVATHNMLNLHSTFTKGTVEFRLFNSTTHAGEIKAYIQFCLAVSHQALTQKKASARKTVTDNEKYAFRCWMLRLGLSGDEFKTCRLHFLKHLEGNSAWRNAA